MTTLLGQTALGGNTANSNNTGIAFAMRKQALASGTVTTLNLHSSDVPAAGNHAALYADNAGALSAATRLSGDITGGSLVSGWNVYTVSPGIDVVINQFYWIEFLAVGFTYNYTDFATSGGTERDTSGQSGCPNPHNTTTNSFTNDFACYADGVLAGGANFVPKRMPMGV